MNKVDKKKPGKTNKSVIDSGNHLLAVLDTVGEGIVTIDSEGTVIMVNREFENIWGYQCDEIIGVNLTILMPEKYRGAHKAGMKRSRQERLSFSAAGLSSRVSEKTGPSSLSKSA